MSGPVSCVGELHCSDTSSLSVSYKKSYVFNPVVLWMTSVIVSGAYLIMTIFSVHVPSFDDERRFAGLGTRYGFFYYGRRDFQYHPNSWRKCLRNYLCSCTSFVDHFQLRVNHALRWQGETILLVICVQLL